MEKLLEDVEVGNRNSECADERAYGGPFETEDENGTDKNWKAHNGAEQGALKQQLRRVARHRDRGRARAPQGLETERDRQGLHEGNGFDPVSAVKELDRLRGDE